MIIEHEQIADGSRLAAEVCIIGAGAAGITLAVELGRAGVDVLLVTGGGRRYSEKDQDFYRGTDETGIPLERSRIRRFGGTTSVWGGRCIPFDPIDFEERDFVPHSGWPIEWEELQPYYRRSQDHLDIGSKFSFEVSDLLPDGQPDLIGGFRDEILKTNRVERWSLPTDLGKKYKDELNALGNVRVLMDSHLVGAELSEDSTEIYRLVCKTDGRRTFECHASRYVFAMGGLETTRHLLQLPKGASNEIGHQSDLLGRFFMTHFSGAIAEISFDPSIDVVNEYEIDVDGVYCRRRLQISASAQKKFRLLNFAAFLHDPPLHDARHGSPVLSLLFLAKGFRGVSLRIPAEYSVELAYRRFAVRDYLPHLRNIIIGVPTLLRAAPGLIYKRLIRRRKLPSVIVKKTSNRFTLYYHVEHAPNPDSRITLSDDLDAHGLRRLHVSMRYSDLDVDSILKAHELIKQRVEEAGIGTLEYLTDNPRQHVARQIGFGGHQLGTTRMATTPDEGVVDVNGRVFGIHNLYVCGPSVFVTGSHANPVLTIVAMAIRLADHLQTDLEAV
jgi:choline dehydrogenase-like flavoprotein